jgi:hypothetical protein
MNLIVYMLRCHHCMVDMHIVLIMCSNMCINLWSQSFKLIEGNFTMFKSEVGFNIVVIESFARRNFVLCNQENND